MRRLINSMIFATLAIFILLVVTLGVAPVRAATIIIAASDSSSQWKSQAAAICDGTADQSEINAYLTTGNIVSLAPGNFWCNDWIYPQTGSRLTGQGNTSVINLSNTAVFVLNVNNVELDHFKLTGTGYYAGAVIITAINTVASGFYVHDIWNTAKGCNDFLIYPNYGKLSNIAFVRCDADNPDGFGFQITGEGTNPTVEDITFYKCSVENAGVAPTRITLGDGSCWITGFDFAESPGLTVNRMQAIKCSVNGAWESAYHFEIAPKKTNCIITDCTAANAGLKTGGAMFGAGYLIPFASGRDDIVLSNNAAYNNRISGCSWGKIADLLVYVESRDNYDVYTPPQDVIFPSSSTKVASRVNQGNCTGLIVTNGDYKELFLYSNDDNAVNQQIELGAVYKANDGKTYSFNGTKIVAQLTDYAVIRLVKSNTTQPPVVITNTASGVTTTGATLNANLTALGTASSVTVSFEYGLTSGYGSIVTGVPQILTTTGAFTANITGLIPNTLYHYRAKAEYVNDGTSYGSDQTFTTLTSPVAPSVTTSALPNGNVGLTYSQTLLAIGGTTPYTWAIASGTLPAGLSLSASGVISGIPTTVGGPTSVNFRVTDRANTTATKTLTITVGYAAWDVNRDGTINVLDMINISQHWGESGTADWILQDVNSDGVINVLDMIIIGQHWTG